MELTLPPASLPHFGPHCEAELPAVCAYGRFQGKVQEVFLRAVLVKGAGELTQETMQGEGSGIRKKRRGAGECWDPGVSAPCPGARSCSVAAVVAQSGGNSRPRFRNKPHANVTQDRNLVFLDSVLVVWFENRVMPHLRSPGTIADRYPEYPDQLRGASVTGAISCAPIVTPDEVGRVLIDTVDTCTRAGCEGSRLSARR